METLNTLLNDLESKIEYSDCINIHVSQREVSWHMAHSLKVVGNIIKALQNSNPEEYHWQFNRNRSFVYILNHIPRGKGKAPKSVLPADDITIIQLQQELNTVRQLVLELEHLNPKSNFKHPYFGQLNLKQTKKFLDIHTKHHLKIIDDIIKKNRPT
ncbi:hypothetical protein [Flavobacterium sp.]|uniref:hypothetical protein n=1 Tax=Flavobacterium sp. TaxID=239 RepID=UPI00286D4A55|nr:hypothetical protein [Flavobacterium sp.]